MGAALRLTLITIGEPPLTSVSNVHSNVGGAGGGGGSGPGGGGGGGSGPGGGLGPAAPLL